MNDGSPETETETGGAGDSKNIADGRPVVVHLCSKKTGVQLAKGGTIHGTLLLTVHCDMHEHEMINDPLLGIK